MCGPAGPVGGDATEEVDAGRLDPTEAAGVLASTILAAIADQTR